MDDAIAITLEELEKQSNLEKTKQFDIPPNDRMLAITKETGELLNMILYMIKAKNTLEVGMSTGYSTIWCAEAIHQKSGKIITIEQNPNKIKRARENFRKAGINDIIDIKEGTAMEILTSMSLDKKYKAFFDFVLIDADKENVIDYFDLILPMVSIGGVIVTDNMLFPEKYKEEMKSFSEHIRKKTNLRTITSPIGNGEEITIKIN